MPKYDDAQFTQVLEKTVVIPAGAATVAGKFSSFATLILKRLGGSAVTAGTGATNTVVVRTNGVAISGGTSTAGTTVANAAIPTVSLGNVVVAPGVVIDFISGADATGSTSVTLEYSQQNA